MLGAVTIGGNAWCGYNRWYCLVRLQWVVVRGAVTMSVKVTQRAVTMERFP